MWRYEIAGEQAPGDWAGFARELFCSDDAGVDWLEYFDVRASRYRAARLVGGALESCIFIGPDVRLPARDWLARLFEQQVLDDAARGSLLTGKPGRGQQDAGRTICACFGVGLNTLLETIRDQRLTTVEQVGELLKAGTNCGSCVPEIRTLLEDADVAQANVGAV